MELFFKAIRRGDEEEVSRRLDEAPMLVEEQEDFVKGFRPVGAAAEAGRLGMMKLLVDRGADVNGRGRWNRTALHWAAEGGREEIVYFLLTKGARSDMRDCAGNTPLRDAFRSGQVGVVQMILQHVGEEGLVERSRWGWTVLMEASGCGRLSAVQMLVETMVLEEQDLQGRTALHWAAIGGHKETNAFLLSIGAQANSREKSGRTPLILACLRGHLGVVQLLLQHMGSHWLEDTDGLGNTALHWASEEGHAEVVDFLLSQGAQANSRDRCDNTPLMKACLSPNAHLGVMRMLLQHMAGQGLEDRDGRGYTVLRWAVEGGHEEVAAFLLSQGAEANTMDAEDRTPLMWLARQTTDYTGVAKVLLEHLGAQGLEERDAEGKTALHWAGQEGNEALVALLLAKGAQASSRDNYGITPLTLAACTGHMGVVRRLVRHMEGWGLEEAEQYGTTALHYAVVGNHPEVVRFLLRAGADHTIRNETGWAPQALAERWGYLGCVTVFQWWEGELERRCLLQRARSLHDAFTTQRDTPAAPVPTFLQARATAGHVLPQVEVVAGQQEEQLGGASGKSPRKASGEAGSTQTAETEWQASAVYVVTQLNEQLFTELMRGFHTPRVDRGAVSGDGSKEGAVEGYDEWHWQDEEDAKEEDDEEEEEEEEEQEEEEQQEEGEEEEEER